MFANSKAKVASLGEVALAEFVFLDLQATLENLLSLGTADGDVDGDLFVSSDTKGTDGVTGLACEVLRPVTSEFRCRNRSGEFLL
jgi:hypothetical protein